MGCRCPIGRRIPPGARNRRSLRGYSRAGRRRSPSRSVCGVRARLDEQAELGHRPRRWARRGSSHSRTVRAANAEARRALAHVAGVCTSEYAGLIEGEQGPVGQLVLVEGPLASVMQLAPTSSMRRSRSPRLPETLELARIVEQGRSPAHRETRVRGRSASGPPRCRRSPAPSHATPYFARLVWLLESHRFVAGAVHAVCARQAPGAGQPLPGRLAVRWSGGSGARR